MKGFLLQEVEKDTATEGQLNEQVFINGQNNSRLLCSVSPKDPRFFSWRKPNTLWTGNAGLDVCISSRQLRRAEDDNCHLQDFFLSVRWDPAGNVFGLFCSSLVGRSTDFCSSSSGWSNPPSLLLLPLPCCVIRKKIGAILMSLAWHPLLFSCRGWALQDEMLPSATFEHLSFTTGDVSSSDNVITSVARRGFLLVHEASLLILLSLSLFRIAKKQQIFRGCSVAFWIWRLGVTAATKTFDQFSYIAQASDVFEPNSHKHDLMSVTSKYIKPLKPFICCYLCRKQPD